MWSPCRFELTKTIEDPAASCRECARCCGSETRLVKNVVNNKNIRNAFLLVYLLLAALAFVGAHTSIIGISCSYHYEIESKNNIDAIDGEESFGISQKEDISLCLVPRTIRLQVFPARYLAIEDLLHTPVYLHEKALLC